MYRPTLVRSAVWLVLLVTLVVLTLSACGGGASHSSGPNNSAPKPDGLTAVDLPVAEGADVHGLVKVDGHDLAVHCTGSGHPTVVILHGWIDEPGITSYDYAGPLRDELKSDFRVCSYDRANVGDSEAVPGTQTPEMVVGDLDGLMEAIGESGPYVLIGQSAGGMVASAYAVAHPDKVAGIVMVDADFDELVTLEDMVPKVSGPAIRRTAGSTARSRSRRSTSARCTSGPTSAATADPKCPSSTWRRSRLPGVTAPSSGPSTRKRSFLSKSHTRPVGPPGSSFG